jgi:shikimate kinase
LAACASFDAADEDWACDEIYASRNDGKEFGFSAENWEAALEFIDKEIRQYLNGGKFADKLKQADGVACSFVDGDENIIFIKEKANV